MFSCEMDDPRITEMDPIRKMWMFYQWLGDQNDDAELAKNHGYLIGSFINPQAVQKLIGESGVSHKSTDAEFDRTTEMMEKEIKMSEQKPSKKKRRKLKT